MPDVDLLLEAERRGLLPPDKLDALQEARKRGLVPAALEGSVSREIPTIEPMPLVPGVDWGDVATSAARGFNRGVDATLNLPRTAVNYGARRLHDLGVVESGEDPLPPVPFATRLSSLNDQEPETWLGRRAQSMGEFAGAGALPGLGMGRLAGSAATEAAPLGRSVANYLASSAGGGAAQDASRYFDLGPGWEMAAGVLGAGVGGAIPGAAIGAAKGASSIERELAGGPADIRNSALTQNANAIAEARSSPNALLERVIPEPDAAHNLTREDVARMVIRAGRNGETPVEIARDYPQLSANDVQNYLRDYDLRNPTPMSVLDLAKEDRNIGGASPVTRLAKSMSGIVPDSETAAGIESRQLGQQGRAQDIIQRATSQAELRRRLDQVEQDYRATRPNPSAPLSQSEAAALDAQQSQAALDFQRQRSAGREMEAAREDLTRRNRAEFDNRYTDLHARPDVPINDELAQILSDPRAKSAWNDALTVAGDRTSPSADEIAKSFGIRNKTGLGLPEEGAPTAPGQGLTAEARYNLQQMALEARIRNAREAGDHEMADQLENLRRGLMEQWHTKSTGQYPEYNQQPLSVPTRTLDYFQRELRDQAKGKDRNVINSFRQRLLDALDPENPGAGSQPIVPGFRQLMEDYRNYRTGDEAFDLGQKMGTKESPSNREVMAQFEAMTPTQQHLFRLGRSRGMLDIVRDRNEGQNAVAPFMNEGAREINRRVFGNAAGDTLNNALGRENITTGTRNDLYRGSPTAQWSSDMEKARTGLKTAVGMAVHRPLVWMDNLAKRLEYHVGERQAGEVLRQLGTTDQPEMLQTLLDLSQRARSAGERHAYVQAISDMRAQQQRAMAAASVANALAYQQNPY